MYRKLDKKYTPKMIAEAMGGLNNYIIKLGNPNSGKIQLRKSTPGNPPGIVAAGSPQEAAGIVMKNGWNEDYAWVYVADVNDKFNEQAFGDPSMGAKQYPKTEVSQVPLSDQ